ncbi:hypothetical protein BDY21DRAFT_358138 [Lineolata rhizophorae]|uniref:Late endosomal/lysosomal adaptor and MAPK and MTOR activator-domain-containing protein n=1 Tax=Lineolata rhizophorae TaxID=578093 RepID=A0A6A6NME4_9PEZI|nr:hypothetical protein BDY21DRAFT_358138 [Lineolata rhizophorae]
MSVAHPMESCLSLFSSCLGLGRKPSDSDASDTTHLLGDPYQQQYGTTGGPAGPHINQPDPEEIKRQRDALERICAQTTDKLIDVAPLTTHHATTVDPVPKLHAEYARLFSERFATISSHGATSNGLYPNPSSSASSTSIPAEEGAEASSPAVTDERAWLKRILEEQGGDGPKDWEVVKGARPGSLFVEFGGVR